jgi:transcription-repair coupling factor (superfamily II helicase)
MYQLRGRVGRSAQQAYAYFFHDGANRLSDEAQVRLDTLAENNELGTGFQIAMRDLELRGAGDILSTRQTGHVAAIGLHLYTQLLTDAVRKLKGENGSAPLAPAALANIRIDLPLPAYLPSAWIPEMDLRLRIYRRMAGLQTSEDVDLLREELSDRFGTIPPAVEHLLFQIDVKILALAANATAVIGRDKTLSVMLPYLPQINRESLAAQLGPQVSVSRTAVELPLDQGDNWQLELLIALEKLATVAETNTELSGI